MRLRPWTPRHLRRLRPGGEGAGGGKGPSGGGALRPGGAAAAKGATNRMKRSSAQVSGVAKRVTRSDIMSRLPRDLVTLDFDATDIRDVFKLLAAKARVNIIFGSDVTSIPPLTLHLSDVPFNEAVQTILSVSGLVTTQVGDSIVRVLTPAQMAKERTTATTLTKVIPLNYTKASDILPEIASRAHGRGPLRRGFGGRQDQLHHTDRVSRGHGHREAASSPSSTCGPSRSSSRPNWWRSP